MLKKNLVWFFLLLLILSINSSALLYQRGQFDWGHLSLAAGVLFLFFTLLFYFRAKKEKTKQRLPMTIKFLVIGFSFLINTWALNEFVPPRPIINQQQIEQEIQNLFLEQEKIIEDVQKLKEEEGNEEIKEYLKRIEEKTLKALELNRQLLNQASKEQKAKLEKRQKMLETSLEIYKKIDACILFYPQEMENFKNCQEEIKEMVSKIEESSKQ